jgi:hypothetical protein
MKIKNTALLLFTVLLITLTACTTTKLSGSYTDEGLAGFW